MGKIETHEDQRLRELSIHALGTQLSDAMTNIEKLKEIIAIQCSDGNRNYDPYMHGMANGLLLAIATIEEREPEYMEAPEAWLCDAEVPA